MDHVVIVGASLAGVRGLETLRRRGFSGRVTVIGAEPHLPYDRPPLSKAVLSDDRSPFDFTLRNAEHYDELGVRLLLGRRAAALDPSHRTIVLEDGAIVDYDAVLIATGSVPRALPPSMGAELPGVHTLRTADDALAIAPAVRAAKRVVVVGAGFIGCEVAASGRALGRDVTVLEALDVPLERALPPSLGLAVARLQRDHGVDLRCGCPVAAFEGHDRIESVRLADGTAVEADVVIVGIGVAPATAWLDGSGLDVTDGVLCDSTCAAVGVRGVYAAGDVARIHHPLLDSALRLEHWTSAAEQGAAAASNLLAGPDSAVPFAEVPYFWSDQFGIKLQFVGWSHPDDEVTDLAGDPDEKRFAAIVTRGDRVVGCFGMNRAPIVMRARALISSGATREDALSLAG
jgi:NADPH-dependent 2,4-dienoyl-CoA reductase/sulfur reductase-like enzyme